MLAGKRESLRKAAQRSKAGLEEEEGEQERLEKYRLEARKSEEALEGMDETKKMANRRLKKIENDLLQMSKVWPEGQLAPPTHVFLVMEFDKKDVLEKEPPYDPKAERKQPKPTKTVEVKQVVLYSKDWKRYGNMG